MMEVSAISREFRQFPGSLTEVLGEDWQFYGNFMERWREIRLGLIQKQIRLDYLESGFSKVDTNGNQDILTSLIQSVDSICISSWFK